MKTAIIEALVDQGLAAHGCARVVPAELIERRQWVAWMLDGEGKKLPLTGPRGATASTTDPQTWCTYDEALECWQKYIKRGGIGYVFSPDDPFTGIDLDHCISPAGLAPWAQAVIDRLASWTEVSVSGTGVHIFVQAQLPGGVGMRAGDIELYDRSRYFTVSGMHIQDTPLTIEVRQAEVDAVIAELFPHRPHTPVPLATTALLRSDEAVLQLALDRWHTFSCLWLGDLGGCKSASEADWGMARMLGKCTRDPEQIERLMWQSGLARSKYQVRGYLSRTISRALDMR